MGLDEIFLSGKTGDKEALMGMSWGAAERGWVSVLCPYPRVIGFHGKQIVNNSIISKTL